MRAALSFKSLADQVLEIERLERTLATAKTNFMRMSGELTASMANGNGADHDDDDDDERGDKPGHKRPRISALDGARRAASRKRRQPAAPKVLRKPKTPAAYSRDGNGRAIRLVQDEINGLLDMGFTASELAKALAVGSGAISHWSRGKRVLSDKYVQATRELFEKAKAGEIKPVDTNGHVAPASLIRRRCFCNFTVRGPSVVNHLKGCAEAAKTVEGLRTVLADPERKSALLAKLVV